MYFTFIYWKSLAQFVSQIIIKRLKLCISLEISKLVEMCLWNTEKLSGRLLECVEELPAAVGEGAS